MVLVDGLIEIILVAVQHVDYSLRCEQDPEKKKFIRHNASFLLETILPRIEHRFEVSAAYDCSRGTRWKS